MMSVLTDAGMYSLALALINLEDNELIVKADRKRRILAFRIAKVRAGVACGPTRETETELDMIAHEIARRGLNYVARPARPIAA